MAFSLRGAMAGLGGAMEVSGLLMLKETLEEQRQSRIVELQAQTQRETHRVNAQTDIENIPARSGADTEALVRRADALRPGLMQTEMEKSDITINAERRKPYTLAPGQQRREGDKVVAQAPEKEIPQEQRNYYAAAAERLNAEAEAIRGGMKYRDRTGAPKVTLPKITKSKDDNGNEILVDQNSGAWGTIEPGKPGKKGEWRLFGPNDPDTPETGPSIKWHHPATGEALPQGLADLYPDIAARQGPSRGGERPPVEGARKASDGKWYVERDSKYLRVDPAKSDQAKPDQVTPREAPAKTGPRGVNATLTHEDQAKINAAKSPAERTRIRQGLILERMRELDEEEAARNASEAGEETARYRSRGIDPGSAAFRTR